MISLTRTVFFGVRRNSRLIGIFLVCLAVAAWVILFSIVPFLWIRLGGDTTAPVHTWAITDVLAQYPQWIAYAFIVGLALWFGSAAPTRIQQPASAENRGKREIWRWDTSHYLRYAAIVGLGGILVLAAIPRTVYPLRFDNNAIVTTSDYDEGLYSEAALLVTQGHLLYHDVMLDQPPLGVYLWSVPLRIAHSPDGSLYDLLRLRLFTALCSLITIAVVYLVGRRLAGPAAGLIAAFVLAVDGSAIRFDQQIYLEPLNNLALALMLLCFLYADPLARGWRGWLPLVGAGILAGLAVTIKVPACTGVAAVGLTLLITRRWRACFVFGLSTLAGFLPVTTYCLSTAGSAYIRMTIINRLLEPANRFTNAKNGVAQGLIAYLAKEPALRLTLLLAVCGFVALIIAWLREGNNIRQAPVSRWLPVPLLAVLTFYLYSGKSGFYPHYYDQFALPLALLAGACIYWRSAFALFARSVIRRRVTVAGWVVRLIQGVALAAVLWVLIPFATPALTAPIALTTDSAVSLNGVMQRAGLHAPGSLYAWDSAYAFVTGRPLPIDRHKHYVIDTIANNQYLSNKLNKRSIWSAIMAPFNPIYLPVGFNLSKPAQDSMRQYLLNARYVVIKTIHDPLYTANMKFLAENFRLCYKDSTILIYEPIGLAASDPRKSCT